MCILDVYQWTYVTFGWMIIGGLLHHILDCLELRLSENAHDNGGPTARRRIDSIFLRSKLHLDITLITSKNLS